MDIVGTKLRAREIENRCLASLVPHSAAHLNQTLGAFAGEMIRKRILGQDPDLVKKTRFSMWELADVGVEKVSDLLRVSADINRQYNADGQLVEVAFDSPLLAFQTPVRAAR